MVADVSTVPLQALVQALQVKLAGPVTGGTPTIMAPATISPLAAFDVGPTPMGDVSPGGSSTFPQRRGGLQRRLLESALHNSARQLGTLADLASPVAWRIHDAGRNNRGSECRSFVFTSDARRIWRGFSCSRGGEHGTRRRASGALGCICWKACC